MSGSCPGGGAGSPPDHVDLAGSRPGQRGHLLRRSHSQPGARSAGLPVRGPDEASSRRPAINPGYPHGPAPNRVMSSAPARRLAITLNRINAISALLLDYGSADLCNRVERIIGDSAPGAFEYRCGRPVGKWVIEALGLGGWANRAGIERLHPRFADLFGWALCTGASAGAPPRVTRSAGRAADWHPCRDRI